MFKRSTKLEPPPAPPTIEEILQDLKTFEIVKSPIIPVRKLDSSSSSSSNNTDSEWWKAFQTFLNDVDELKKIRTELNGYKLKLEEAQLEMEITSKNIQNDIDYNLEKTRKEFSD